VAKKYEDIFHADCGTLGLDLFDVVPRATDHIPEQIAMIQDLESK
jgi:cysteinyl-tRNA synthetase